MDVETNTMGWFDISGTGSQHRVKGLKDLIKNGKIFDAVCEEPKALLSLPQKSSKA